MAHPSGVTHKHEPAWLDRMKQAEDGKDSIDYSGNLMHNPALPTPGAPPNPVAPPSEED